jgi:hypothetical protein
MEIYENTKSELRVVDSTAVGGKISVIDEETEEVGTVISKASDNKLIVHWQDSEESETHNELEVVSIDSPNVSFVKVKEIGEVEYVRNPFGFGEKKQFYVNFWEGNGDEDDEYHQTLITAKNEKAAIKIAKRGYKNFTLDSVEKVNPSGIERVKQNPPRHRRFAKRN